MVDFVLEYPTKQVISGVFIMGIGVLILTNAFARMAGLFTFFI